MSGRAVSRLGLIGLGKHGARYARHIRADCPDLTLVAIARRDAEQARRAARELGAVPYTDYRVMLREASLDAAVVVVPPTLHVEIVRAAAAAGVPVLLEKPAAPTLSAGRELQAVLRAHPIPLMVAQTLRYNGVVAALRAALESIGPLRSLAFTQRFEPSPLGWLDDPAVAGGGITLHTGVHGFDLMLWLSGLAADAVTCQRAAIHTGRTEDNFAATVSLGGCAALATLSCSRSAGARNGTIELAGERGTLLGDHVLNRAFRVTGGSVEALPLGPPAATVREVLRAFVAALRAGGPMPITLADGLRAVAVADACATAAAQGRTTPVERV